MGTPTSRQTDRRGERERDGKGIELRTLWWLSRDKTGKADKT